MCEANGGVIELDDSFVGTGLERLDDALAISVRRRDQIDRRSREGGYLEQDIEGLAGQPGEAAAEQVLQGLGNRQRSAGDGPRVGAYELAPQLQREERDCPPSPPARGRVRGASGRGRVAPQAADAPRPD